MGDAPAFVAFPGMGGSEVQGPRSEVRSQRSEVGGRRDAKRTMDDRRWSMVKSRRDEGGEPIATGIGMG